MQLPSRGGLLEPRRCCVLKGAFLGRVGLPRANHAKATMEAPGLGPGFGSAERSLAVDVASEDGDGPPASSQQDRLFGKRP